jgi:hypothetical protein
LLSALRLPFRQIRFRLVLALAQERVADRQQLMCHCNDRFLGASSCRNSSVEVCQGTLLHAYRRVGCLHQTRAQPLVAAPMLVEPRLPALSLFPGHSLAQLARCAASRKRSTSLPISATSYSATRLPIRGMLSKSPALHSNSAPLTTCWRFNRRPTTRLARRRWQFGWL